jgi:hypothetical protein
MPGAVRRTLTDDLDRAVAKSRRTGRLERRFTSFMWMTRATWGLKPGVIEGGGDAGRSLLAFHRHLGEQGELTLLDPVLHATRAQ